MGRKRTYLYLQVSLVLRAPAGLTTSLVAIHRNDFTMVHLHHRHVSSRYEAKVKHMRRRNWCCSRNACRSVPEMVFRRNNLDWLDDVGGSVGTRMRESIRSPIHSRVSKTKTSFSKHLEEVEHISFEYLRLQGRRHVQRLRWCTFSQCLKVRPHADTTASARCS